MSSRSEEVLNTGRWQPGPRLAVSEIELCAWLGQALPGDVLQYYRGFLALDTVPHSHRLREHERIELIKVARRCRWASEKRLVHLLQRRLGIDDYTYVLVARPRPKTAPVFLCELTAPEGTSVGGQRGIEEEP